MCVLKHTCISGYRRVQLSVDILRPQYPASSQTFSELHLKYINTSIDTTLGLLTLCSAVLLFNSLGSDSGMFVCGEINEATQDNVHQTLSDHN